MVNASVTSDKVAYSPFDTMNIKNRISNESLNAVLNGLTAHTTVYRPNGEVFWSQAAGLPQLLPTNLKDLDYAIPLGQALPGNYQIILFVKDSQGVEQAIDDKIVTVESSAQNGEGLVGSLNAEPKPVLKSEDIFLSAAVENLGNDGIQNLPLQLSVVDPQSQQIVDQWNHNVPSLVIQDQFMVNEHTQIMGPVGETYVATLSTDAFGSPKILAQDTFVIADKFPAKFALGEKGRVLALVDSICAGVKNLELSSEFEAPLSIDSQVTVEVLDQFNALVDSETATLVDFVAPYNASTGSIGVDLTLTELTSQRLSAQISTVDSQQNKLSDEYTVNVSVIDGVNQFAFSSGVIQTNCETPISIGDDHEMFKIVALDTIPALSPEDKTAFASVDQPSMESQEAALKGLLQQAGWSYTLVNNAQGFTEELDSGGYTVLALLSERVTLDKQALQAVQSAVENGAGLINASGQDYRRTELAQTLGVDFEFGSLVADSVVLQNSELSQAGSQPLNLVNKLQKVVVNDAQVIGNFGFSTGNTDVAVVRYNYGKGKSVHAGFDLLAEYAQTPNASLLADLLRNSFDGVHPEKLTPILGAVSPIEFSLTNIGQASSGEVLLTQPIDSVVIDPGPAQVNQTGQLIWPFTLQTDETKKLTYWLRLPSDVSQQNFKAEIQIGSTPPLQYYGDVHWSINPADMQTITDLYARAKPGKINIVWTPVVGAESYNIYRSTTSGGPYELIASEHLTDYAVYADFGLTNGITYYYVVTSNTNGFESLYSYEANATPQDTRRTR
jgi:hypothetical protein